MHRTLVESEHYAARREAFSADATRLDEALRYPLYAISTKPESFPEVPGTRLRRVRTNAFPGAPAVLILFTIDNENECTLWSLEPLPTQPELSWLPDEDDEDDAS